MMNHNRLTGLGAKGFNSALPAPTLALPVGMPRSWTSSLSVTMQSEAPLTLILSRLRAGRGELERTRLGSLIGDPHAMPTEGSPLPFEKGEGQGEGSSQLHRYGLELPPGGYRSELTNSSRSAASCAVRFC